MSTTLGGGQVDESRLREGVRVEYNPVGGGQTHTTGVIKKVITDTETAGSAERTVKGTEEEPRYLIENEHTHKETPYKKSNIVRIVE